MTTSAKDRDSFISLEFESRTLTNKLVDVSTRRSVCKTWWPRTPGLCAFDETDMEVWAVHTGELLMQALRDVVNEMAVVRRRIVERNVKVEEKDTKKYADDGMERIGVTNLAFAVDQEYHRKLELLETLRCLGEFEDATQGLAFFQSFREAWRSDSMFGCFHFDTESFEPVLE